MRKFITGIKCRRQRAVNKSLATKQTCQGKNPLGWVVPKAMVSHLHTGGATKGGHLHIRGEHCARQKSYVVLVWSPKPNAPDARLRGLNAPIGVSDRVSVPQSPVVQTPLTCRVSWCSPVVQYPYHSMVPETAAVLQRFWQNKLCFTPLALEKTQELAKKQS